MSSLSSDNVAKLTTGTANWSESDYDRAFEQFDPPKSQFGAVCGPVRYLVDSVGLMFGEPTVRLRCLLAGVPNISPEGIGGGLFYGASSDAVSFSLDAVALADGTTLREGEISSVSANQIATGPPNPGRLPFEAPGDTERYLNVHVALRFENDATQGVFFDRLDIARGTLELRFPVGLTEHLLEVDRGGQVSHEGAAVGYSREGGEYYFHFSDAERVHGIQALDADQNPAGFHTGRATTEADWRVKWRRDDPDLFRVFFAKGYARRRFPFEFPFSLGRIELAPQDVGETLCLDNGTELIVDRFDVADGKSVIEYSPADLPVVEFLGVSKDDGEYEETGVIGPGKATIRNEVFMAHCYYRLEGDRVEGWR